ncbi:MAG: hypothetical protein JXB38_11295 [Anaerolineales bacterium]|nr:hypothetical protein [Anaerolineales bacterium]
MTVRRRLWLARLLIAAVFFINVEVGLEFIIRPEIFAPGFEVSGVVGAAIVRAIGLLFLMWNVPYAFAAFHPMKQRVSLYEALIMQTIGLVGESYILWNLPSGHPAAAATITRFIAFDGSGLVVLLIAFALTYKLKPEAC